MKQLTVILGGSSGIGFSICNRLKDEYQVVNMSRSKNPEVDNIFVDVEKIDTIYDAFKKLKKKYGIPPKILVYSAGFVDPQGIREIDAEILKKTFMVNLIGAFVSTKCFVDLCDKFQESKIIYIASTAGTRPQPGWSAYSSSKAGLINFALTMNEELKSYNIKTYCISPARTATPLRRILAPNENQDLIMQPSEISDFIYYLITQDHVLNNQNIIIKRESIGGQ